jgi:hypothetical protein
MTHRIDLKEFVRRISHLSLRDWSVEASGNKYAILDNSEDELLIKTSDIGSYNIVGGKAFEWAVEGISREDSSPRIVARNDKCLIHIE